MRYVDNQPIVWNRVKGRIICARNRGDAMRVARNGGIALPDPVTFGHDHFGDYVRFSTMDGDISQTEADFYKANVGAIPKRAFMSFESVGETERYGKLITQRFGLVVEPGPTLTGNLFTVLAQDNAHPPPGTNWRPPPMEFGLVCIGRTRRREDGKIVGVIDPATRRPFQDEYFQLKANLWNDTTKKNEPAGMIRSREPIERGRFYREISIGFRDGRGGPGFLDLSIDGVRQSERYAGPTGYAGFGSVYPAYGVYQHVGQKPLSARFYNWHEDAWPRFPPR